MPGAEGFRIEVAYAEPERQLVIPVSLDRACTVVDAVRAAVSDARSGQGTQMVELRYFRRLGHAHGDELGRQQPDPQRDVDRVGQRGEHGLPRQVAVGDRGLRHVRRDHPDVS